MATLGDASISRQPVGQEPTQQPTSDSSALAKESAPAFELNDLRLAGGRFMEIRGLRTNEGLYEYVQRTNHTPETAAVINREVVAMLPLIYDSQGEYDEPYVALTVQDRPVLTEQYGRLVHVADVMAGLVSDKEEGEDELTAGLKEAAEEGGLGDFTEVTKIGEAFTSPGLSNEGAAFFVGKLDASIGEMLEESKEAVFGAEGETEMIKRHLIPLSKFLDPTFSIADQDIVEDPKLSIFRSYLLRQVEFAEYRTLRALPDVLDAFGEVAEPAPISFSEREDSLSDLGISTLWEGKHLNYLSVPKIGPNGKTTNWEYAARRCAGVAGAIALNADDEVVLTLSLREPIGNSYVLDIPACLYGREENPDESVEGALASMLQEKTGHTLSSDSRICPITAMPNTAGMVSEVTQIKLVQGLHREISGGNFPWIYPVTIPRKDFISMNLFAPTGEIPLGLPGNVRAAHIDPKVFFAQQLLASLDL